MAQNTVPTIFGNIPASDKRISKSLAENTANQQAFMADPNNDILTGFYNWLNNPGGLPRDLRRAGNFIADHPLAATGAGAAVVAAPFTGGSSLLGLGMLGSAGAAMGAGADSVVNHIPQLENYAKGIDSTPPVATPQSNASGGPLFAGYTGLLPPQAGGGGPVTPTTLPPPEGMTGGKMGSPVDMGPSRVATPPPEVPVPQGRDYSTVDALLNEAKAQPIDPAITRDADISNVLAGLASGATGHTVAEVLANVGAGVSTAVAQNKNSAKVSAIQKELERQKAVLRQADLEVDKVNAKADDAKAIDNAHFNNAKLRYDYAEKQVELAQPKILSANQYGITYMVNNPTTGRAEMKTYDTGLVDRLAQTKHTLKGLGGTDGMVDLASTKMAESSDPYIGPFVNSALGMQEKGTLDTFATAEGLQDEMNAAAQQAADNVRLHNPQATAEMVQAEINKAKINAVGLYLMSQSAAKGQNGQSTTGQPAK